ncbi:unnamed protein product [Peniophora sp. CBMAI 1063]|nr:unnamed protein product [Peniophora sp. CBMAI 1063]
MAEPSAILAEALNGVTQATFKALRAYEQRSRKGVGEKERELEDLTAERDDAVEDAARLRKQQSTLMKENEQLKAELERMDLAHSHQTQLVDDLREEARQWKQEAEQWKQQCLRIEESSRQQITDWKDQYLRAEAERTRVLVRYENVLKQSSADPFASSHRTPGGTHADPTASGSRTGAVSARGSTEKPVVSPIAPLLPTPSTHNPTPGPSQTVIRRVSTTFTLEPEVKTEEESDNERLTPPTPTASRPRKNAVGSSSKTKARNDDSGDSEDEPVRVKARPPRPHTKPSAKKAPHVPSASRANRRPEPYLESEPLDDVDGLSPLKVRVKRAPRRSNVPRELDSDEEMNEDDDELDMVSDEGAASASRNRRPTPKAPKNGAARRAAEPASSRKRKLPPDAAATPAATPGRAKKQR